MDPAKSAAVRLSGAPPWARCGGAASRTSHPAAPSESAVANPAGPAPTTAAVKWVFKDRLVFYARLAHRPQPCNGRKSADSFKYRSKIRIETASHNVINLSFLLRGAASGSNARGRHITNNSIKSVIIAFAVYALSIDGFMSPRPRWSEQSVCLASVRLC